MTSAAASPRAIGPLTEQRSIRLFERLARPLTRRSVVPVAVLLTLIFGIGDRVTGVELPFTILYVLPIGLGAWLRDLRFGMVLSALATACIGISLVHDHTSPLALVWNLGGAVLLFFAVTWCIDQLHAYVERERTERRMAVDQLRHAERLGVIGTLATGVAHELGTPLNVIAGCAEFLAEDSTDPTVHRRTSMIIEQVSKVSAIIRHLLDFGHRGGVERTAVDVNALVTTTAEMLASTARKHDATIALDLGPPLQVDGSVAELGQVLSNLILNGLQAMARHGTVRVSTRIEQRAGEAVACIAVEDQGTGIAAEDLARIFDPFFTRKGVGEGTGLGLSVSYGIARDHEGAIEVTSEPGHGSRFTVVLPLRA
ncbi:MAG: ATP-binding protein [Proteobacteria bacterium]|nr:ATP-binding protein [Pseudomonadota bacterium]